MTENYGIITNTELEEMQSFFDIHFSDDPAELKERLSMLAAYHSRLTFCIPLAKRELRAKKTSKINETIIDIAKKQFLARNVQNALLDSICEEEQFLVDRLERMQSSCHKSMMAASTVLSYQKEDLKNAPYHRT